MHHQLTKSPVLQPNQKGLQFLVDEKQAELVFGKLITRLEVKGPPYNFAEVPQADHLLPDNLVKGSADHAIFLFALCLWMRGGVESDTATSFLKRMHENRKELFEPSYYAEGGKRETEDLISEVASSFNTHSLAQRIDENSRGWVYNMRKLARFWSGDPRKLMDDSPDFDTLSKRIMGKTSKGAISKKGEEFFNEDRAEGFMYFREKMVAMIAYFLMDAGLVPLFYAPVPVDFHVFRLLVSNRILKVRGKSERASLGIDFHNERTKALARYISEWYCRKHRVSPVALCDALWLLSRNFCRNNPGNSGYVYDKKRAADAKIRQRGTMTGHPAFGFLAEIKRELEIEKSAVADIGDEEAIPEEFSGRKRYRGLRFSNEQLQRGSKMERIERSCGKCPLHMTCKFNISAGYYYVGGKLVPERLRVKLAFKHHDLFDGEHGNGASAPISQTVRFAQIKMP